MFLGETESFVGSKSSSHHFLSWRFPYIGSTHFMLVVSPFVLLARCDIALWLPKSTIIELKESLVGE